MRVGAFFALLLMVSLANAVCGPQPGQTSFAVEGSMVNSRDGSMQNDCFRISFGHVDARRAVPSLDSIQKRVTFSVNPVQGAGPIVFERNSYAGFRPSAGRALAASEGLSSCFEVIQENRGNGISINLNYKPMCQTCGQDYVITTQFSLANRPGVTGTLVIPFEVPCPADITLLTVRSRLGGQSFMGTSYDEAISDYLVWNANQDRKVRYVELDSVLAQRAFQFRLPQNFGMGSVAASRALVGPVRAVLRQTRSTYVGLLGGVTVIPQVRKQDFETGTRIPGRGYFMSVDGFSVSDDDYSKERDGARPSRIVFRIPTPPSLPLSSPVNIIAGTITADTRSSREIDLSQVVMVGDACGNFASEGECELRSLANTLSRRVFSVQGGCGSGSCRLAPSFCHKAFVNGRETQGDECNSEASLTSFANADSMILVVHGDGRNVIAKGTAYGEDYQYLILAPSQFDDGRGNGFIAEEAFFPGKPVVFSASCYTGAIDAYVSVDRNTGALVQVGGGRSETNLLSLTLLRAGASALVGRTRVGFVEDPAFDELIYRFFDSGNRRDLGHLFLQMKQREYDSRPSSLLNRLAEARSDLQLVRQRRAEFQEELRELNRIGSNANMAPFLRRHLSCSHIGFPQSIFTSTYDCLEASMRRNIEERNERERELSSTMYMLLQLEGQRQPEQAAQLMRNANAEEIVLYGSPFRRLS